MKYTVFSKLLIYSIFLCWTIWGMSCQNSEATTKENKQEVIASSEAKKIEKDERKNILFLGTSLTAAYGLDLTQGYTTIIQKRLDSLDLNYKVINAGLSGETTAGGNERIDWVIRQKVDIFVLESGANDGLRGIDPAASYENLQSMINKVKTKYPAVKIILAGMLAPPNMGDAFTNEFKKMYPKLAKENDTALIPFFLEGVAGHPDLNLKDGIHPNVEGQKVVAENVWAVLKKVL